MVKRKQGNLEKRLSRTCPPPCGKKFSTNRKNKIYCSTPCQWAAWSTKNPRKMIRKDEGQI